MYTIRNFRPPRHPTSTRSHHHTAMQRAPAERPQGKFARRTPFRRDPPRSGKLANRGSFFFRAGNLVTQPDTHRPSTALAALELAKVSAGTAHAERRRSRNQEQTGRQVPNSRQDGRPGNSVTRMVAGKSVARWSPSKSRTNTREWGLCFWYSRILLAHRVVARD